MPKEVRFDIYCKYCKLSHKSASDEPCNKCLGKPDNDGTQMPIAFKRGKALVNYLIDGETLSDRYTRDPLKSRNWKEQIPTDNELKLYFEKRKASKHSDDVDWFEKEV